MNSASSRSKRTVAPKLDTLPKGKVSSPWQTGKYPNRFCGCWQGEVSQLKCLPLQTSQLKFRMTFSMTRMPQGNLVICRAHELWKAAQGAPLQIHQGASLKVS